MTGTGIQSVLQSVLELTGIDKAFAGNPVLRNVQLRLYPGEIHALMGQNGAGRSTLTKGLTGVLESSGGQMLWMGQPIRPDSPLAAQKLGTSTVYQEINLSPSLSVAENVFAGRYPRHGWQQGYRIDWCTVHRRARALLACIGLDIEKLFEVLRRFRGDDLVIVFVSHFLNQVYAISDRIAVLRDRRKVGELPGGSSEDEVYAMITADHV